MSNFDVDIDSLLGNEGGYVNLAKDPGGETNWGISKRSYPSVDIKNLTRAAAIEIYRTDFWDKCHCDVMPKMVAFQALDFAVNSGIPRATKSLQAAIGATPDGEWGPASTAAMLAAHDASMTLRFIAARLRFMTNLDTWRDFGKGWANRIAADLDFAADDFDTREAA